MSSTGPLEEDFAAVFAAAKEVIKARGVHSPGEARLTYAEGSLEVARTEADEYEVRCEGALVFRCRVGGGRSGAHVFEPGEWMVRLAQVVRGLGLADA